MKREFNQNTPLKVLILSPYSVFPLESGGRVRIYEFARGLAQLGVDVTLTVPLSRTQWRSEKINNHLEIKVIPYPFIHTLLFTDRPLPYFYLVSMHPGYRFFLREIHQEYDVYQFEHVSFAGLLKAIPESKVVVYDSHNVEYDYVRAECKTDWAKDNVPRRIKKLEAKLLERANHTLSCSPGDKSRFLQLYDTSEDRISIYPNGIHIHSQIPDSEAGIVFQRFPELKNFKQRAIFSGSNVEHNRDAVQFILEILAPKLRTEVAFVIRGACALNYQNRSASNVFFDPQEMDMRAYAKACTVGLNPVNLGSGTSMKVTYCLAHGLPVISTKFGMRGYQELEKYVTICRRDEFAEVLLRPQSFQPGIFPHLEKYSWDYITRNIAKLYRSLVK